MLPQPRQFQQSSLLHLRLYRVCLSCRRRPARLLRQLPRSRPLLPATFQHRLRFALSRRVRVFPRLFPWRQFRPWSLSVGSRWRSTSFVLERPRPFSTASFPLRPEAGSASSFSQRDRPFSLPVIPALLVVAAGRKPPPRSPVSTLLIKL